MIPPIGPGEKALALLVVRFVVRFKEIRMRETYSAQLLHHRVYFLWFIVIAVRKHISELTRIELAGLTGIWAEDSPRRLVGCP